MEELKHKIHCLEVEIYRLERELKNSKEMSQIKAEEEAFESVLRVETMKTLIISEISHSED